VIEDRLQRGDQVKGYTYDVLSIITYHVFQCFCSGVRLFLYGVDFQSVAACCV